MKRTKAARSRRVDPLPGLTLNFEILGVALFVVAGLLAISLISADAAGYFGAFANATMHAWFGGAAWLAVVALAVIASIIFLEIHVPKIMAAFAGCAAGAFLALAGFFGMAGTGGALGNAIAHAMTALFGVAGADIVLGFVVVACIVTPTGISLKRVFGSIGASVATAAGGLADTTREALRKSKEERDEAAQYRAQLAPPERIAEPALIPQENPTHADLMVRVDETASATELEPVALVEPDLAVGAGAATAPATGTTPAPRAKPARPASSHRGRLSPARLRAFQSARKARS